MNFTRLLCSLSPLALWCALFPCTAAAGLIIEQEITVNGHSRRVMIRIQDGLARFDYGNGSSAFIDLKKQNVLTHFHHDAIGQEEQGPEALRRAAELVNTGYAPPPRKPETRTEKIGRFECRVSDWRTGDDRQTIWTTKAYPAQGAIHEFLPALRALQCTCLPALSDSAIAVKAEVARKDHVHTTTLLSAKVEKIPADIFKRPTQYRKDRP